MNEPVIVDKLNELDWLNKVVHLPAPTGELLPAEERLQNVLKAIEDRILYEKGVWEQLLWEEDMGFWSDDDPTLAKHRNFMSGLDIVWSLAQTEALRRQSVDGVPDLLPPAP